MKLEAGGGTIVRIEEGGSSSSGQSSQSGNLGNAVKIREIRTDNISGVLEFDNDKGFIKLAKFNLIGWNVVLLSANFSILFIKNLILLSLASVTAKSSAIFWIFGKIVSRIKRFLSMTCSVISKEEFTWFTKKDLNFINSSSVRH